MKRAFVLVLLVSAVVHAQNEFSEANATEFVRILAEEIGPRPMGSSGEQRALQIAVDHFRAVGCDTAYLLPMTRTRAGNTNSGVAVGIRKGASGRIIVIGGHIDSSGPEIPGANDNASGSAVVMELSRVFAQHPMQSTLVFALFGGEERGLLGSKHFVRNFDEIDSVVMMLNIDMASGLGIIEVDGTMGTACAPRWLMRAAFEEFHAAGYRGLRYPTHFFSVNNASGGGVGSDHFSFLEAGIPAISFTTDPCHPIHTPQDHLANFDPRGLKRSGDVVLNLVKRFDAGVPSRELESYWLYAIGSTPIFVPHRAIPIFLGITLLVTSLTFLIIRRRKDRFPEPIRWSGARMLLFTLIVVTCGWVSSDIVGLLKGYRYPWFTELHLFYILAALWVLLGVWISLQLSRKLPLSRGPYYWYARSSIWLVLVTLLFTALHIELGIYPAVALFLLSLAMLVPIRSIKLALFVLSPLWMMRLIFSEWDEFVFRVIAMGGVAIATPLASLGYNAMMVIGLTLYVFPFALGFAAVYRAAGSPEQLFRPLRSRAAAIVLGVPIVGMTVYLIPREVYNEMWYRQVRIMSHLEPARPTALNGEAEYVTVQSAEYLRGIRVSRPSGDTLIAGRRTLARISIQAQDYSYGMSARGRLELIEREFVKSGDTTVVHLRVFLESEPQAHKLTIRFSAGNRDIEGFEAPWMFTTEGREKVIRWLPPPDTVIDLRVTFQVVGHDSIDVHAEYSLPGIPFPLEFERDKTSFIYRTRITAAATLTPEVLLMHTREGKVPFQLVDNP